MHPLQSAVAHCQGLDSIVQHGDPVVVTAAHEALASGGHPIRDQHGIIERIVRIPAMLIFFSFMVRRRQRMRSRSLSEKRRWPEGFLNGRMRPSRSYSRMVGAEIPSVRAASPMEYHRPAERAGACAESWITGVREIYICD
jgi:hypothetical protein